MGVTTHDVNKLIAARHGAKTGGLGVEWALFFELANGTGSRVNQRYVDAFAMHLWPSKGHTRIAYEVKVSRADFIRELEQPDNRSWGMEISNEFWFVAPAGVAKEEEIPQDCGILQVSKNGKRLRKVVCARYRNARDLTINEVASFARRSCPGEVYNSLRFRYSGQELSNEQLNELIHEQRSDEERYRISREVNERIKLYEENVRRVFSAYAEALREAGCTPPPWMHGYTRFDNIGEGVWSAKNWVRDNVSPGPAPNALWDAERALEASISNLKRQHQAISALREQASSTGEDAA